MLTVTNPKTFDWSSMPLLDCAKGNALDSYFTLKLFHCLLEIMEEEGSDKLYEHLMSPITPVFVDMEYAGINISREALQKVGKELRDTNINGEDSLYDHENLGITDNLASGKDMVGIFYTREDGFGLYPPDKTSKGNPSVSAPTLKILLGQIEEELAKRNG